MVIGDEIRVQPGNVSTLSLEGGLRCTIGRSARGLVLASNSRLKSPQRLGERIIVRRFPVGREREQGARDPPDPVIRGVLFRRVFLQEGAVRCLKRLAMHEPVEHSIQRIGWLYVMEIPWKHEDRDSF
jgi:hypothetical protein